MARKVSWRKRIGKSSPTEPLKWICQFLNFDLFQPIQNQFLMEVAIFRCQSVDSIGERR